MANMAYCRFENTFGDLQECYEHLDDDLGTAETRYRLRLIALCRKIASDYGDEADAACHDEWEG